MLIAMDRSGGRFCWVLVTLCTLPGCLTTPAKPNHPDQLPSAADLTKATDKPGGSGSLAKNEPPKSKLQLVPFESTLTSTMREQQPAAIRLKEIGPTTVTVGQEAGYALTLTNAGTIHAQGLTVRLNIPSGLLYSRSDPPAIVDADQLVWTVSDLPGGASRELKGYFRAERIGTTASRSNVTTLDGQRDTSEIAIVVAAPAVPALHVTASGPAKVDLVRRGGNTSADPIPFAFVVSNHGNSSAKNVVLHAEFDSGLKHATGLNPLELVLGTLAAGASRSVSLPLAPDRGGSYLCRVSARADDTADVRAEHKLIVLESALTVRIQGPTTRYAGRPMQWDIEVGNAGDQPLTNVVVRNFLPPELAFVCATDDARLNGREVDWLVNLKPGELRHLKATTTGQKLTAGCRNLVMATAGQVIDSSGRLVADARRGPPIEARAEASVKIVGLPSVTARIVKGDDPLEKGTTTTYKIYVTNNGSLPAEKVRIICSSTEQLKITNATGPTQNRRDDRRIAFEPLATLYPNQAEPFTVEVQGVQAGSGRLRIELTTSTITDPIVQELSTTIR